MKKKLFSKILSLGLTVFCLFSFSGCGLRGCMALTGFLMLIASFEEESVQDPAKYGQFSKYVVLPEWFPESIENYEVQGYSYRLLAYMDICYEVYLDVVMTEAQLEETLQTVLSAGNPYDRETYYAEGFYELVFEDEYSIYEESEGENVGWATIEKLVYNPTTGEVIFECFHAHDTGVYPLSEVAFFNRFGINEREYQANASFTKENL